MVTGIIPPGGPGPEGDDIPVFTGKVISPTTVAWSSPDDDEFFLALTQQSSQVIYEQALNEGLAVEGEDSILYGNYAISPGTSIEHIWGDNLGILTEIRRRWDPKDVMSLTGGWKIPLS